MSGNKYIRGQDHIVFGGILQSYIQNNGTDANASFSVQVVDPREILSNVVIILNNYAGSVYNNKNYYNVYGFLEYDVSDKLKETFENTRIHGFNVGPVESVKTWYPVDPNDLGTTSLDVSLFASFQWLRSAFYEKDSIKDENILEKVVDKSTGEVYYFGNDMYRFPKLNFSNFESFLGEGPVSFPEFFPMTGEGFSRRGDNGIPWYRVRQALNALFNYNGLLPKEYVDAGFGGYINFRGYNYVVDFTGIPIDKIPLTYFLDFDQIDLLSLSQELCDVISHDMFVSLLPIIDHPSCEFLYNYNRYWMERNAPDKIIAGIIRVDAIDRTRPPKIGAIKEYIDELEKANIHVENKDLGYELSNITTDKFVVGAQEVEMYYFNNNKDRDNLQFRKWKAGDGRGLEWINENQWSMDVSLKQQILPFYGFLGKDAVTIPRGFGSYQQILLDTSGLDAYGVGNYYVATEMELRAAAISYEQWSRFLLQYNETFMEEIGENFNLYKNLTASAPENQTNIFSIPTGISSIRPHIDFLTNREFGISVPRCVFASDKNYMGPDGYPASPCSPPYGYPLYYKRAEKIGIPEAGIANFIGVQKACISNYEELQKNFEKRDERIKLVDSLLKKERKYNWSYKDFIDTQSDIDKLKEIDPSGTWLKLAYIKETFLENSPLIKNASRLSEQHLKNAKKVYNFIKNVADNHLGKTFLIKIPKQCNVNYSDQIRLTLDQPLQINNIEYGPYGFKPLPISSGINQFLPNSNSLNILLAPQKADSRNNYINGGITVGNDLFHHYLDFDKPKEFKYSYGALKNNFNPISEKWEFNYVPEPQGGFFNFAMFDRNLSLTQSLDIDKTKLPYAQYQLMAPMDLTNFISNNGRLSCYARYDNSQYLDLSSVGSDNMTQQYLDPAKGFVPDILEELENTNNDNRNSFEQIANRLSNSNYAQKIPSIAFVKCEINDSFYMTPKTKKQKVEVFGRTYDYVITVPEPEEIEVTDDNGCKIKTKAQVYPTPIFTPGPNGGSDKTFVEISEFDRKYSNEFDAEIIETEKEKLNPDHVYAIITVPGRIMPSVDQRFVDGPNQAVNGVSIKHLLTMDVVRGAPGFEKPAPIINSKLDICNFYTAKQLSEAQKAAKEVYKKNGFANPEITIGFSQPSPIYPDLVVLPLMSRERCYGPWLSSSIVNGSDDDRKRYSDLGGKVEFVKDENLAPWNYAGYQLMNEAGALQAQFSNSLLLYTERGGFIVPDIPSGVALAKSLKDQGPLVTSMSVDIGDSVKTTIKMDLYTSRFGKLQKQKEQAIAQIVRERQKIIDQNNSNIRKGIGKSVSGTNLVTPILKNAIKKFEQVEDYTSLEKGAPFSNQISFYTNSYDRDLQLEDGTKIKKTEKAKSSNLENSKEIGEKLATANDSNSAEKLAYSSANASMAQIFEPISNLPSHSDFPSILPTNIGQSRSKLA
jgi:hypothetical protein